MMRIGVVRRFQCSVVAAGILLSNGALAACARDDVRCRLAEQKAQQAEKQQGQSSSAHGAHTGGATRWNKEAPADADSQSEDSEDDTEESDD